MSILKRSFKKEIENIEPKEAFTLIEKHRNDPDLVILDVRTPEEYQKDHLENARLLDIKSKDFEEKLEKMDKDKDYIVYCRVGRRGMIALDLMKKHGYKNVMNITGGIEKWKKNRLPVTNE